MLFAVCYYYFRFHFYASFSLAAERGDVAENISSLIEISSAPLHDSLFFAMMLRYFAARRSDISHAALIM